MSTCNKTQLVGLILASLILLVGRTAWAATLTPPDSTKIKSKFITQDTIWEGQVIVKGLIKVSEEATLTIKPGTQVLFTRRDTDNDGLGEHAIHLQGRLIARGTKEQPIVFTSAEETKRSGDWDGIHFILSDNWVNIIEYCKISYARQGIHSHYTNLWLKHNTFSHNLRAIYCQEMKVELVDNRIVSNYSGIRCREVDMLLKDNLFENNYWGIHMRNSQLVAIGNRFRNNLVHGMRIRQVEGYLEGNEFSKNRWGARFLESKLSLIDNLVQSNYELGISCFKSELDMRGNQILGNQRVGIWVRSSPVMLSDNQISGNGEGIQLRDSTLSIIEGNQISNNGLAGLASQNSRLIISDNRIRENQDGIRIKQGASVVRKANEIDANRRHGISGEECGAYIWDNLIHHNGEDGLSFKKSSINVGGNDIHHQQQSGIDCQERSAANLQENIIEYNREAGVEIHQGDIIAKENIIRSNNLGLWIDKSGVVVVLYNRIETNATIGIMCDTIIGNIQGNLISDNGQQGIKSVLAEFSLRNNLIKNNKEQGILDNASRILISNNQVRENQLGIQLNATETAVIKDNLIYSNLKEGILSIETEALNIEGNKLSGNTIGLATDNEARLLENNIYDNLEYGIFLTGESDIKAERNWWGTTDEDAIDELIYDIQDEDELGEVWYGPVSQSPVSIRGLDAEN